MSGDTITLSIELSPTALRRQSAMLEQMADVLEAIPKTAGEKLCKELDNGKGLPSHAAGDGGSIPNPPLNITDLSNPPPPPPEASQPIAPGLSCEVDAEGLPWDSRIHSSSKAKNKTGTWKVARNMDPKLVAKVRAELIALRDSAKGSAPAPVTPVASEPAPPAPPFVNTLTGQPPAPPAPPAPSGPAAVSAKTDDAAKFTALLRLISTSRNENQLTAAQVNETLVKHGIPQLGLLAKRPDLFDAIRVDIDNVILSNQIAAVQ